MHSRNLQLTLAWILLASLIMGVALWQAQVVVEREAAGKHKDLPPPTNTRHAIRPALTASEIDPVADYVARCEKGMAIQEIRWVLTDFENAGLATEKSNNDMTEAEATAHHKAQRQWYLGCLAEGLNLSHEQKKEMSDTMSKLIRQLYELNQKDLQDDDASAQERRPDHSLSVEGFDLRHLNLIMNFYFGWNEHMQSLLPWKLCKLTPPQAGLTWNYWHHLTFPEPSSSMGIDASPDHPGLLDPRKLAEKTGGPVFRASNPIDTTSTGIPYWLDVTNLIHPLLASQKLPDASADPEDSLDEKESEKFTRQLQALHPVQLKMALLLNPDLVQKIRETFDAAQN